MKVGTGISLTAKTRRSLTRVSLVKTENKLGVVPLKKFIQFKDLMGSGKDFYDSRVSDVDFCFSNQILKLISYEGPFQANLNIFSIEKIHFF